MACNALHFILRTKYLFFTLFVAMCLAVVGCSSPPSKLEGKINFGAYEGEIAALVWVAKEQNFFKQVGLDVDVTPFSAGKLAADALSKGDMDIVTCAEFVFVKKSFSEGNLRVLGAVAASQTNWLVGRKDKGVHTPSDLRGKRIGVTLGSAGEYYLGRFLTTHDLQFTDVSTVNMTPPDIVKSMREGKIDAALTWHPNVYFIQQRLKSNAQSFKAQGGQSFYFILLSKNDWLASHEEHAKRLMQALLLAEKWILKHPEEAKNLLSNIFGIDRSYLQATWMSNRMKVFFPQSLVVAMNGEKRWLMRRKLVARHDSPNLSVYLYPDAMHSVKPHAVTVIK